MGQRPPLAMVAAATLMPSVVAVSEHIWKYSSSVSCHVWQGQGLGGQLQGGAGGGLEGGEAWREGLGLLHHVAQAPVLRSRRLREAWRA